MAEFTSHNWISAYLDGELAPSEAADAERRLEADSIAREELHALRDVRELVVSLPKQILPSEFTATVLQRCERETLLAISPSQTVTETKPSTTRNWGLWTASLLTTAFVLFLAAKLVITPADSRHEQNPTTIASANKKRRLVDSVLAEASTKQLRPEGDSVSPTNAAAGSSAKNLTQSLRTVPSPVGKFKNGLENSAKFGGGFDKSKRKFGPLSPNIARQAIKGIEIDESVQIGDVIPYFAVPGDHTAVIELVVVDINKSIGQLEILLSAKKVTAAFHNKVKKDAVLGQSSSQIAERQMIAVYVESTPLQMAAVLREIREKTRSLEIGLKPPRTFGEIQLAKTHDAAKAESAKENRDKTPFTLAKAVAVARKMVATRNQNSETKSVTGNLGGTKASPGTSTPEPAANATPIQSFRMRVTLAGQSEMPSTSTTSPKRFETNGQPKRDRNESSAKTKSATPAVRVIFLFRKQAAHRRSAAKKPDES